jgi:hypothetical protein
MNYHRVKLFLILLSAILTNSDTNIVFAQTKNPDISVITDFRTFIHNDKLRSATKGKLNIDLQSMELAIQGYLNPYARADIYIAKHGTEGEIEIEEACATFLRGLPFGINMKAGKYLIDFGKLNTLHPHVYSFVDRPLIHQLYFGEDGLNDIGINANILLPTGDIYTNFSVNVLKGNYVESHTHVSEEVPDHDEESNEYQPLGFSSRFSSHFQITDYSNLELGVSGLTGIHDKEFKLRHYLAGLDLKYKWRPNRYQSLTIQTESILNHQNILEYYPEEADERMIKSVNGFGLFAFLDYQFKQRWNAGFMTEIGKTPEDPQEKFWSHAIFAGFSPMEESSVFRILLRREKIPAGDAFNSIIVQLVFSLGPHKPHVF